MLLHVSMPADDCRQVALVLAELIDGLPLRFPPGGGEAWNVWSKDDLTQIVITPRGDYLMPGTDDAQTVRRPADERASETHFALAVTRPASEIVAIAARVGWPARVCDRGTFFQAAELWVEGAYLVELLDPACLAAYRRSMTADNWRAHFGG